MFYSSNWTISWSLTYNVGPLSTESNAMTAPLLHLFCQNLGVSFVLMCVITICGPPWTEFSLFFLTEDFQHFFNASNYRAQSITAWHVFAGYFILHVYIASNTAIPACDFKTFDQPLIGSLLFWPSWLHMLLIPVHIYVSSYRSSYIK